MAAPPICPSLYRCGLLNCEVVLELLLQQLVGTSECEQMVRTRGTLCVREWGGGLRGSVW